MCRIGLRVYRLEVLDQPLARCQMRGHFGEPDRGFDRFDLAEEGTDAAELMVSPVLEQSSRLRRHLPLAGRQMAPGIDLAADLVDDGRQVVGLLLRRQAASLVEDQFLLLRASPPLLRLGDGGDELGSAAPLERFPVGWPDSSSSQCWRGYSYGELTIGRSKNGFDIRS